MKKLVLIPAIFLCACVNTSGDQQSTDQVMSNGAYMLNGILSAATQMHQQREKTKQAETITKQTEAVMAPRTKAIENMGY